MPQPGSLGGLQEHKRFHHRYGPAQMAGCDKQSTQHADTLDGTSILLRVEDRFVGCITMQYCSARTVSTLKWGRGWDIIHQVNIDMTCPHIRSCSHLFSRQRDQCVLWSGFKDCFLDKLLKGHFFIQHRDDILPAVFQAIGHRLHHSELHNRWVNVFFRHVLCGFISSCLCHEDHRDAQSGTIFWLNSVFANESRR